MKRIVFIAILIGFLLVIKNLVTSIYTLWQKQDLLVQAQKQLEAEKIRNMRLKKDLATARSPQFVEEQARNKLFLVKEGEQEVLLSKNLGATGSAESKNSQEPNWQQWLRLFF